MNFNSIRIVAGAISACDAIQVRDDTILEGDEEITFSINGVVSVLAVTVVAPTSHTLTIQDNDGQSICF